MKPGINLWTHLLRGFERTKQMDVVRHDDVVTHPISLAVEMEQRVGYDLGQVLSPKQTRAVARVQKILSDPVKLLVKGCPGRWFQRRHDFGPMCPIRDAADSQPFLLLLLPSLEDIGGNRVPCAERYKRDHTVLGPMGQIVPSDPAVGVRIEQGAEHSPSP